MLRIILWAALLAGVGAGVGLGIAKFTTPVYEARANVLATGAGDPLAARGEALSLLRSNALYQRAVDSAAKAHPELNSKRQAELLPSHGASQGDGGSALEVRVQSTDPKTAADVANAMVTVYNSKAATSNSAAMAATRADIAQKAGAAKSSVDELQKQIQATEERTGVMSTDVAITTAATYSATLSQQADTARNQLAATQKRLAAEQEKFEALAPTTEGPVVEASNPKLDADIQELQKLQAQRVGLLNTYLPTSQRVAGVDVQIAAQQSLISSEKLQSLTVQRKEIQPNPQRLAVAKSVADDEAQVASLNASIAELGKAQIRQKASTRTLPADEARMVELQRELDLATAQYKQLRASADSLDLNGTATQLPILSTVFNAEPPRVPVWPDTNLMISVGAAIGVVLGVIVGVGTNSRAEELEAVEALPQAQVGPELPSRMTAPPLPARRGEGLESLALPSAIPAEVYRFMVFSMLSGGEETTRTILFTGVTNDALCSEAAAQFAIAMSQSGVRTLLADCNLRHQALTEAFGFKGKSGISDMLSKTMLPTADGDLILSTQHPDLYFMPSGSEDSEGLGGYPNLQITGLVQDLKERADVKVLNAPACAMVADAPRLVKFADHVCLVASKADRSRGLVAKAHEILKRAGATDVDVLVIDRDESGNSFLG